MVTLHEVEQGSPEWLELRKGKYTGSNADKLLKFGAIEYSEAGDGGGTSFWMKRGHVLEEEAFELYNRIFEKKYGVENFAYITGLVTNDKYPKCAYSPDGLTSQTLLEIKCFDLPEHKKLISGEISFKILAQCHYGMFLTERGLTHLIAYNPSKELAVQEQFKIIPIKAKRTIQTNFRRILK